MPRKFPGADFLQNSYGPFDYRDYSVRQRNLPVVEQYHFTPDVRSLQRGRSGTVIGDIDYTLRAFPNHPGALDSVARYELHGGRFESETIRSADCFFRRAVVFAEGDPVVRVLYANYLFKRGQKDEARTQYEEALKLAPDSPEISYNAGLFFLEVGDLARAKELAKIAYGKGYPLQGLKNKIDAAEAHSAKQ